MKSAFESRFAEYILENIYRCTVPDNATRTEGYLDLVGSPSTGFAEYDREIRNTRVSVVVNIPTILEYYLNGIDVDIPSPDDRLEIHKLIVGYLDEWRYHIANSINVRVTEHDKFLKDLEELSRALYETMSDDYADPEENHMPTFIHRPINIVERPSVVHERRDYDDKYGSIFDVINAKKDRE